MQEYRNLKDLKKQISDFRKERIAESFQPKLKKLKAALKERKKTYKDDALRLAQIKNREKELTALDKRVKHRLQEYEEQNYTIPYSHFRTLTKGPKYYEILTEVELVIHVRAESQVLQDILEHIYDLKAIGRSEDVVEVLEAELVELKEVKRAAKSLYHGYISTKAVDERLIWEQKRDVGGVAQGTRYFLNKDYKIVDGKRIFNKKAVVYTSNYYVKAGTSHSDIFLDCFGSEQKDAYIVNFI